MHYLATTLFYLLSTINGQPQTCLDILPIGPVQTIQNCQQTVLNGDCCGCTPKVNTPYECVTEGCAVGICPIKTIGAPNTPNTPNTPISSNQATTNPNPITTINIPNSQPKYQPNSYYPNSYNPNSHSIDDDSIDDDDYIDDDVLDINGNIESDDGASSDHTNDDDLDERSSISASFENESQEENRLDGQHVYNKNGEDDGAERTAAVTFSKSAFSGILFGTIGVSIMVIIMIVIYCFYKRAVDVEIHRKLSIPTEEDVECENKEMAIDISKLKSNDIVL